MIAVLGVVGCGPAPLQAAFFDADTLRAELDEWRGPKEGVVWLKRAVHVHVDTGTEAANLRSQVVLHLVRARLGAASGAAESFELGVPWQAILGSIEARIVADDGVHPAFLTSHGVGPGRGLDPESGRHLGLVFAALEPGQILEVLVRLEHPGTLVADARPLGAPDGPTAELFLEYRMAPHVQAAFQVVGKQARPVVADTDGQRRMALYEANLPRQEGAEPYARFVVRTANPRNYKQIHVATWADAAADLIRAWVTESVALRQSHLAPMRPAGSPEEQILEVARWVRDRVDAPDRASHDWREARPLPAALASSGLRGAEKLHLLHWLLDEISVPHLLAAGRSAAYPKLDPTFPTPGGFDVPLVYVPQMDLWIDPGCRDCEPGRVRPALAGRQALLLSGAPMEVVDLPEEGSK
jgi:hypothetical protein